jgi:hypothetical protein
VFVPDVEVKLRVDRKKEFKPSCHPWLRLRKSSSRFAGR